MISQLSKASGKQSHLMSHCVIFLCLQLFNVTIQLSVMKCNN